MQTWFWYVSKISQKAGLHLHVILCHLLFYWPQLQIFLVIIFSLFLTAVTARLHRLRLPTGEPEFQIEGRVEFVRQGPLLPYDTQHLLQQWLLINSRCAHALVRPGRSQLYVLIGSVQQDGTLSLTRAFPWYKKDLNIAVAIRKWKHHRCWMDRKRNLKSVLWNT